MLTEYTTPFVESKEQFIAWLKEQDYPSYETLLHKAIELSVAGNDSYKRPDPSRIHVINDGDYQGTLVFVIGATGYQPDVYWYTKVYYGSCTGCDALEGAWGYGTDRDWESLWTLTLHMMQGLKELGGEVGIGRSVGGDER